MFMDIERQTFLSEIDQEVKKKKESSEKPEVKLEEEVQVKEGK
jgi:hypothetical protein